MFCTKLLSCSHACFTVMFSSSYTHPWVKNQFYLLWRSFKVKICTQLWMYLHLTWCPRPHLHSLHHPPPSTPPTPRPRYSQELLISCYLLRFQPIKYMCEWLFIWLNRHKFSTSARPLNQKHTRHYIPVARREPWQWILLHVCGLIYHLLLQFNLFVLI